ncbi:glycosyltransferase [Virgibacillus sp. M23]|uniref:glycosyltransferase family 2 protein n=1 Tax=Virgibacillus sp. M23 TaxID=3079030 RepID=UPI002A915CC4|nr:glycosyltransferase [Virgibacillus sp. M23]MDY7043661.1 glycosyltransferase [Virgibacillus sp. M23]
MGLAKQDNLIETEVGESVIDKRRDKKKKKSDINIGAKLFIVFIFVITVSGMLYVNYMSKGKFDLFLGVYGSMMVTYLLGKMALSFFYKPYASIKGKNLKVSVVIPSYNESSQSLSSTIESLLEQDYPIYEIIVVDDGSKDLSGYHSLNEMKDGINQVASTSESSSSNTPYLRVHKLEKNVGKRHAQAWAFERVEGDIIVTIDSDAHVASDAIKELISPFKDSKVKATTGHLHARNKGDNLFTKLIDMRYDNAFRVERSAQSVTGNVLVCSGCFSAYRTEVILSNLEHYKNQTFLGEKVQFGDDRCLTNYAILEGKTLYQSTAHCYTDVPSGIKQFLKQQIRWNKSFFRESLIAMKIGLKKPTVLVWAVLEMLLWILFGVAIVFGVILKSSTFGLIMATYYFAYICLSAYARNAYYILRNPLIFLMAPVYGIIHITLLIPLRLYALVTIRQNGWGTR